MKNVLHFFGELLVEGTGGSSVFKNFHGSSNSDLTSEKGTAVDNTDAVHENELKRKQLKSIKRHRRWNISKVGN